MDLSLQMILLIAVISFLCEYMDATLGMGYGTTLTPLFLLMGYCPGQIVPAILVSQLVCGFLAGIFHHAEGNVNFRPRNRDVFRIYRMIHPVAYLQSVRQSFPLHLKAALLFGLCSGVGAVGAVLVAVTIPPFWLKLYIGVLVLSMGILILVLFNRKLSFSFWKITCLGLLASFNKCLSGGGYGPVITAGQILSGMEGKNAIGITALSEGITCAAGVAMYCLIGRAHADWHLTPWIVLGAVFSVPLSAKSVKFIPERKLKAAIAVLTIILGGLTLVKLLA